MPVSTCNVRFFLFNNMAEGKKSFLFYSDWIATFKELPKDKGYDLLMHILQYVNDEDPQTDDILINALFSQIKTTLKRDLEKWEDMKVDRSYNGRIGNLKRYNPALYDGVISGLYTLDQAENLAKSRKDSPSEVSDRVRSQEVANVAVNVNANVSDSVNVNDKKKINMVSEIEVYFEGQPLVIELAKMWLKYKKDRKEQYKSTMWLATLSKQISDYGIQSVTDAMHQAIGSNYQGYFPKKQNSQQQQTNGSNKYKISM